MKITTKASRYIYKKTYENYFSHFITGFNMLISGIGLACCLLENFGITRCVLSYDIFLSARA